MAPKNRVKVNPKSRFLDSAFDGVSFDPLSAQSYNRPVLAALSLLPAIHRAGMVEAQMMQPVCVIERMQCHETERWRLTRPRPNDFLEGS